MDEPGFVSLRTLMLIAVQASRKKNGKRLRVGGGTRAKGIPAVRTASPKKPSVILAVLLFVSGAAALIYQLLWIKQLSLIVGVEVYAITTAVSAFFAGLALGGAALGRIADRDQRPLRLYARLELGIGLSAIAVTVALAGAARPFAVLENQFGVAAWLPLFLLVAAPAFLMGGTLPVLLSTLAPDSSHVARAGGILYASNTAGAVAGALATPFFLLPQFGVRNSSLVAAGLNIIVGVSALLLDQSSEPRAIRPQASDSPRIPFEAKFALALYAVAGGIALGYEVVWSQAVIPFMSTRSFAFAIVLAVFLAGLMLGSAIYARFADRVQRPWRVFGVLIATAGLLALCGLSGIGNWFIFFQYYAGHAAYTATSNVMVEMCVRFLAAAIVVIFPCALLLGAAFPAALRLAVNAGYLGRDAGAVVGLNTAGGIFGTLVTGFLLIPHLGVVRSLAVLAIAATVVGIAASVYDPATRRMGSAENATTPSKFAAWPVAAVGVLTVAVGLLTPPQKLVDLIPHIHGSAGSVLFHEDDPGGTVAVVDEHAATASFRRLFIQGVSNSGDSLPSLRYMRLQTFIPLLIHSGEPRSVLVIGLGTGITAGATLRYPGLKVRVCDELLLGVIRATHLFQGNFGVGSDPNIEIRHRDGRRDLLQSSQRYDVITLEPPPPSAAGVVNLYSRDFYKLAATRLETGGIFAQWLPIATQNDDDSRSLVRSFLDVFPYATLWTTELHEMLLVGSFRPIELDVSRITQRFNQPEVAQALREVGVDSPEALLATWMMDREGLKLYAAGTEPVTDDRPRIEYATWVRPGEITKSLPALLALRTSPPLRNADDSEWNDVDRNRDRLLALYEAGLAAYDGDRERWAHIVSHFGDADLDNAYYRWLLGGAAASGPPRVAP